MAKALSMYLRSRPSDNKYVVQHVKEPKHTPYIRLIATISGPQGSPVEVKIAVDTGSHHKTVGAMLSRLIKHLEKADTNRALYVRYSPRPFPGPAQWSDNNSLLSELTASLRGASLFLTPDQAARWYAILQLNYAVTDGAICCDTATGIRSISESDYRHFLETEVSGASDPAFKELDQFFVASQAEDE